MIRMVCGLLLLGLLCSHASILAAQAAPCEKACQQDKVDALFKRMDEASDTRPGPSMSRECVTYNGHDVLDPLVDVCAKLKFVRSLPAGARTEFSCPKDTTALIGLTGSRIREVWGEPDFVDQVASQSSGTERARWTYYIGSPKPGWYGGGFPLVSLYLVAGSVEKVDCARAK